MHILQLSRLVSLLSTLEVCLNYALLHFSPTKPVFEKVMENLETNGIQVFQFPGLASHGIELLVMETPRKL